MIRLFQLLSACIVLAIIGFFILQQAPEADPSKYKYLAAKYPSESQEYRALYAQHSAMDDIPLPVGSWEAYTSAGHHYLLKVNKSGGFVLSLNPNANDSTEGAVTGTLSVTGSAFIAKHVVGSAKKFIPKSGHIVVKQYTPKQVQVIHPHSLEVLSFKSLPI